MKSEHYLADLKAAVFESRFAHDSNNDKPIAFFTLDKEFNWTTPFFVYDFITELYQLYGKRIDVASLSDGCIRLSSIFSSSKSSNDIDFRYLMMTDSNYHSVFSRYAVNRIEIYRFRDRDRRTDLDWNRFHITQGGKPLPY